jgi:hypothetical protein
VSTRCSCAVTGKRTHVIPDLLLVTVYSRSSFRSGNGDVEGTKVPRVCWAADERGTRINQYVVVSGFTLALTLGTKTAFPNADHINDGISNDNEELEYENIGLYSGPSVRYSL